MEKIRLNQQKRQLLKKEWLAKNHEAFSLLLTNVGNSDNASETNNHN